MEGLELLLLLLLLLLFEGMSASVVGPNHHCTNPPTSHPIPDTAARGWEGLGGLDASAPAMLVVVTPPAVVVGVCG